MSSEAVASLKTSTKRWGLTGATVILFAALLFWLHAIAPSRLVGIWSIPSGMVTMEFTRDGHCITVADFGERPIKVEFPYRQIDDHTIEVDAGSGQKVRMVFQVKSGKLSMSRADGMYPTGEMTRISTSPWPWSLLEKFR